MKKAMRVFLILGWIGSDACAAPVELILPNKLVALHELKAP